MRMLAKTAGDRSLQRRKICIFYRFLKHLLTALLLPKKEKNMKNIQSSASNVKGM